MPEFDSEASRSPALPSPLSSSSTQHITMANLGVPTKLLHESLGHIITVELKTGQIYRGKLFDGQYTQSSFVAERDS